MNNDALKRQIGLRVKQFRNIKNLSRQKAADLLGISLTAYGDIERGKTDINITRLGQIAEVFEIALTDLLGSTEKNIFNFIQENKCDNWQVASPPPDKINELLLKNELEKSQLTQQAQAKENELLKQQNEQLQQQNLQLNAQLQEMIALMKAKH